MTEEPRDYYVTMRRGITKPRVAWLAGPFETHFAALIMVDSARTLACKLDPWADFDFFGTASCTRGKGPIGRLNEQLGIADKKTAFPWEINQTPPR
jgi:hypothetical protein